MKKLKKASMLVLGVAVSSALIMEINAISKKHEERYSHLDNVLEEKVQRIEELKDENQALREELRKVSDDLASVKTEVNYLKKN